MNLVIASNNEHKIREIKEILKEHFDNILSLKEANINCEPLENGQTLLENALIKANEISKFTNYAVLADDTGLCVDALNGEPGINSARFAGDHDNVKNRKKLLCLLENEHNRAAHFSTFVVLRYPNGEIISTEGRVDGFILEQEDGINGFGYDSIFYCTEIQKSFGMANRQEKNSISHRARALRSLLKIINNAS